ncbi:MAG: DNA methyltransferase [candidate division Zixibacteria bacterium]
MDIIRHPIPPQKGLAWHNRSHPYFTKQASNVVNQYISHYSKEKDLIFDPFGGTGVTAIEAITLRRKVVIMDINPLACFIIKQTCNNIDINAFAKEFDKIKENLKKTIEELDKMSLPKLEKHLQNYWYPKNIPLPSNSDFELVEDLFSTKQLLAISMLHQEIKQIKSKSIREMMKYVFSSTISKVNLTYMPSERGGKTRGGGGPSITGKYRYWRPKISRELPVWENFEARFRMIFKGKKKWNEITGDMCIDDYLTVIQDTVLNTPKYLEDKSVDYIYTDPPYGGNIAYLDLSTMWNAWLGFKVTNNIRKQEIIEGGDLEKSQDDFTNLLSNSFEKMGSVLKKNGWLSCVFAHKKLEYWNVILESCEDNAMEFKGSVFQPTNNTSIHYKTNPANVLCSQRIANFKKTFNKSVRKRPDDLQKYILNEMERACIENAGAAIDDIYQRVLDQLLHRNSIGEAKKKGYLKLNKLLDDDELFEYDPETDLYYVKNKKDQHLEFEEEYFKYKDEVKTLLIELFKEKEALSIDEIHKELFDIFKEDKKFPIHKDLDVLLSELAIKSPKSGKWVLNKIIGAQSEFALSNVIRKRLIKVKSNGNSHSEIIFRLVLIGQYLGFKSWIGKREQSKDGFQNFKFAELSISTLTFEKMSKPQHDAISQIDVIWLDKLGFPRYAFEIEESTNILSGFERFRNLLEVSSEISNNLFIVAPKSRRRKIEKSFKDSTYVGHPIYLENKVGFIFKENLVKFYDTHIEKTFTENNLKEIFQSIVISKN